MGRQRGLVQLSGQFGDTQLYVDRGKGFAKMITPVTKEQIKKAPGYALTRNNNSEFAGAVLVVGALMDALGTQWNLFAERFFTPRLKGNVRKLMLQGPGNDGERQFEVAAHRGFFRGIDLDKADPFDRRFMAPHTVTVNADRNTATLTVAPFTTRHTVAVPGGATHFQVFLTAGVLTDFVFTDGRYAPSNPDLCGSSTLVCSSSIPCDGRMHPGFQLTAALADLPVLQADACLVVGLGIEFFRDLGEMQEMASGRAMKVQGAY